MDSNDENGDSDDKNCITCTIKYILLYLLSCWDNCVAKLCTMILRPFCKIFC